MKRLFNDPRYFNIFSAFVAFSFWGSWAYYINHTETGSEGIISGLTQGGMSFIITFFMATLVTFLYQKINYFSLFIAPLLTVVITGLLLAAVHFVVSTPNIFFTIAPTLMVSFFFCLFVAYKLK